MPKSVCACSWSHCHELQQRIRHSTPGDAWDGLYRVTVVPGKSNLKTWLFLIGILHHLAGVREKIFNKKSASIQFNLARHHFPRCFLEDLQSTHKIGSLCVPINSVLASKMCQLDGGRARIMEKCNTVEGLLSRASKILNDELLKEFQVALSKDNKRKKPLDRGYFLQVPLNTLVDVQGFVTTMSGERGQRAARREHKR